MTSNVTRYEKQCDEIWQAMWQALWQYCLCKGLLVKVHLFLATYFCLQWRSKYFRPKLRSKSRYTSWHLTLWREGKVTAYYMNFEVKGNIYLHIYNDNQNRNIWQYLTRKNMTTFWWYVTRKNVTTFWRYLTRKNMTIFWRYLTRKNMRTCPSSFSTSSPAGTELCKPDMWSAACNIG